ncbi:MAG: hypothetical protein KZQ64_09295 [gamma proteobacterium symbiont of Bathyaustriella thionipta]|nr:hypothetical protein [gamma proteobacterium symbiont of Bathyaustriella thionipta]MCU7953569.1 hypothetical protein [gamma proteobacterium symbiont of Bathyaustriella thionipta]MCU7955925.1 hypothetical protein [gamma proteobacterium symbiont of Bathyaustriella thionipta]MCU7967718.1 hypothetical protein [gamma proteobacterium symbiont of Bathyaustriella thionipta]
MSDDFKRTRQSSWLDGADACWLESMYDAYLENPDSIEPQWRTQFAALKKNL